VVLCRSADRRSKEQAMHDKFSRRIEVAVKRLATRISRSKRRLDREQVNLGGDNQGENRIASPGLFPKY
jgi:hypothetical protein